MADEQPDYTAMRQMLRRLWESACRDMPQRPSCTVGGGRFVLTIRGNRENWEHLLVLNGVPENAQRSEEGDVLTCSWPSHADAIFGPGGLLSQKFPGYEVRLPQVHMARIVQRAIEMHDTAVIEAGTGVGKSFAYAAVCMAMNKRVVISTSNKALQAQLYRKDIPFLQTLFPGKSVALALGKSNYACRDKAEDGFNGVRIAEPQLRDWYEETNTGNVEEIRFPVSRDDLAALTVDDDCTGKDCPLYYACFYYAARDARMLADVVICNHALLAQHQVTGHLLPEWNVLVVDEAHNIVDEMRSAVGSELTINGLHRAAHLAALYVAAETVQFAEALVEAFRKELFADVLEPVDGTTQADVPPGKEFATGERLYRSLLDLADIVWEPLDAPSGQGQSKQAKRAERIRSAATKLQMFIYRSDIVRWIECGRDRLALCAVPHYVGDVLSAMAQAAPTIYTSATLATPTLAPFMGRIGAGDALQMVAPSPFPYRQNALIFLPRGSEPKPRDLEYNRYLADTLEKLVTASKGGALLLFTSIRQMRDMHAVLSYKFTKGLKLNVFLQGAGVNRAELTRAFRSDGNGVLFATRSFFEGVDIGGDALRLVVLDKLPFEAPSPLGNAIQQAAGARAFDAVQMPDMLITLKQAVGRLIRTSTDRGVIAVLDSRIRTQWSRRVLESLPPAPNTWDLLDVQSFYAPAGRQEQVPEFVQPALLTPAVAYR